MLLSFLKMKFSVTGLLFLSLLHHCGNNPVVGHHFIFLMSVFQHYVAWQKSTNLRHVKDEMINNDTSVGQRNKSESPTGIEPMTSQTLGRRSIHWVMRTYGERGHLTEFLCYTHVLHTARISKVDVGARPFNSAKWPRSPSALVAQWIECPPGVWDVMSSIPVVDSDFFLCPMLMSLLIISSFTFNLPSWKFTITFITGSPSSKCERIYCCVTFQIYMQGFVWGK